MRDEEVGRLKEIVYSISAGGVIPFACQREGSRVYLDPLNLKRKIQLPESDAEPCIVVLPK